MNIWTVIGTAMILFVPASLLTWVWTGDHRWFASGLLVIAFLLLGNWVAKDKQP